MKSTGSVFQVPSVILNNSVIFCNDLKIHYVVFLLNSGIGLLSLYFNLPFLLFKITRNISVEVRTCYDLFISSPQALINDYLGVISPVFKILNSHVPKSTMVANDPFKVPSSTSMMY